MTAIEQSASRDETEEILIDGADRWKLGLSPDQIRRFLIYRDTLLEWNSSRMNLTRLSRPRDIAAEHFLDSLSILTVIEIAHGAALLDIGPGSGLPSLALKIARPDLHVTLLEATAKKLDFCRAAAEAAGLGEIAMIHGRAEVVPNTLRARFDIVTARAVAPLSRLVGWCAPYLKPHGLLVALKGARAQEELREAGPALRQFELTAEVHMAEIAASDRTHAIVVCRRS